MARESMLVAVLPPGFEPESMEEIVARALHRSAKPRLVQPTDAGRAARPSPEPVLPAKVVPDLHLVTSVEKAPEQIAPSVAADTPSVPVATAQVVPDRHAQTTYRLEAVRRFETMQFACENGIQIYASDFETLMTYIGLAGGGVRGDSIAWTRALVLGAQRAEISITLLHKLAHDELPESESRTRVLAQLGAADVGVRFQILLELVKGLLTSRTVNILAQLGADNIQIHPGLLHKFVLDELPQSERKKYILEQLNTLKEVLSLSEMPSLAQRLFSRWQNARARLRANQKVRKAAQRLRKEKAQKEAKLQERVARLERREAAAEGRRLEAFLQVPVEGAIHVNAPAIQRHLTAMPVYGMRMQIVTAEGFRSAVEEVAPLGRLSMIRRAGMPVEVKQTIKISAGPSGEQKKDPQPARDRLQQFEQERARARQHIIG
jgi:hypothetical protein